MKEKVIAVVMESVLTLEHEGRVPTAEGIVQVLLARLIIATESSNATLEEILKVGYSDLSVLR